MTALIGLHMLKRKLKPIYNKTKNTAVQTFCHKRFVYYFGSCIVLKS